jgi:PhnB protein
MATINPYLNFSGNTETAFQLYKSVFKTEFTSLVRFKEGGDPTKLSEAEGEKLMHVSLPIGKGNFLFGTDVLESSGFPLTSGDNINLSITADSKEEADHILNGLSEGGTVIMPMQDTFWGAYFGMCTDPFGIKWLISYDYPKV